MNSNKRVGSAIIVSIQRGTGLKIADSRGRPSEQDEETMLNFRGIAGPWVAMVVILALAGCSAVDPVFQPTTKEVKSDWTLKDVATGQSVELSSLRGKVIFINVWATWCPPCRNELPSIQRLYEKFKGDPNVAFLLVSIDFSSDTVDEFLAKNKYSMPMYIANPNTIPAEFQTEGIPATFIIGPDYQIHESVVGGYEWDSRWVVQLLDRLSSQSTKTASNPVSTKVK